MAAEVTILCADSSLYYCSSVTDFIYPATGSKGATYVVLAGPGGTLYCPCRGYFWRKHCHHITDLIESGVYCGWMGFFDGGACPVDASGRAHCPRCGELAVHSELAAA